jgi:dienelactone hydrolase
MLIRDNGIGLRYDIVSIYYLIVADERNTMTIVPYCLRFAPSLALLCMLFAVSAKAQIPSADPPAPDAPLHERILNIPGDKARPVTLQVTELTPDGPGPFPLAMVNHGATNISQSNRGERYHSTFAAYYFLSRGYAVVLPMMRGFAGSGGSIEHRGCDLASLGVSNAKDIRAVIDYMTAQPNIDGGRIVMSGQSFGGWNTLAFGTLNDPSVRGLISFSGGIRTSDCTVQDASLIAASAYYGAHTAVPSLWFFGENDQVFPTSTWQAMYQRYVKAGGRAELIDYGKFMNDAHQMLSHPEGLAIWTPKVDAFLERLGLPATPIHPEYLPMPLPTPTHFAAIDDVAAVPFLSQRGREVYRIFLSKPFPRAFAIGADGSVAASSQGYDPLRKAISVCGHGRIPCSLYAVNDYVVWTKQVQLAAVKPDAQPIFHRTVPADATATIDFSSSVNPDCSSRGLPTVRITQPPLHGTAKVGERDSYPKFSPGSPYATCNTVKVPGIAVDYTPSIGFTGTDLLTFEVVTTDHQDRIFRVAILVQ